MSEELEAQPVKKNHLGPHYKPYRMPKSVDAFCHHIANGENQTQSYKLAYPKAKYQNPHRLLSREDVQKRIAVLKEIRFKGNALSLAEKRDFLARAVRTPIAEITEASDLAQKVTREVRGDKEGDRAGADDVTILKIESVSKLAAIAEDSKLAGDYFADQQQAKSPGFAFLLDFARFIEGGVKNALPPEPKAIDI